MQQNANYNQQVRSIMSSQNDLLCFECNLSPLRCVLNWQFCIDNYCFIPYVVSFAFYHDILNRHNL